nr:MAG TPA: Protein of unknown function (DUF1642) [Caudoviricetes sp.]
MSTMKSVKDFIKEVDTDSEPMKNWKDNCLEYLETLKPIVPNEIAAWYDQQTNRNASYILRMYKGEIGTMPPYVKEWIDNLGGVSHVVLIDMARFGYRKEKVSRFVLKTTSSMFMTNDYYVIQKGQYAYQLTTDIAKATKFTLTELTQIPRSLNMAMETKEVYL